MLTVAQERQQAVGHLDVYAEVFTDEMTGHLGFISQ